MRKENEKKKSSNVLLIVAVIALGIAAVLMFLNNQKAVTNEEYFLSLLKKELPSEINNFEIVPSLQPTPGSTMCNAQGICSQDSYFSGWSGDDVNDYKYPVTQDGLTSCMTDAMKACQDSQGEGAILVVKDCIEWQKQQCELRGQQGECKFDSPGIDLTDCYINSVDYWDSTTNCIAIFDRNFNIINFKCERHNIENFPDPAGYISCSATREARATWSCSEKTTRPIY